MMSDNRRRLSMTRMKHIADASIVGGGAMTAPIWITYLEQFNLLVAALTGLAGLIYVCGKLYYLIKYHGHIKD